MQGEQIDQINEDHNAEEFSSKTKEILSNFIGVNTIVSVFDDIKEANTFAAGFVHGVSSEHVLLKHVTPRGKYDGFRVIFLEDIFKIKIRSSYDKKLEKLYFRQKQSHPRFDLKSESLIKDILHYAQSNELIISATLNYSGVDDLTGYVNEISTNMIIIESVSESGGKDGICTVNIDDITSLVCDTEDKIMLRLLSTNQDIKL